MTDTNETANVQPQASGDDARAAAQLAIEATRALADYAVKVLADLGELYPQPAPVEEMPEPISVQRCTQYVGDWRCIYEWYHAGPMHRLPNGYEWPVVSDSDR